MNVRVIFLILSSVIYANGVGAQGLQVWVNRPMAMLYLRRITCSHSPTITGRTMIIVLNGGI